jgi:hypothetical protein
MKRTYPAIATAMPAIEKHNRVDHLEEVDSIADHQLLDLVKARTLRGRNSGQPPTRIEASADRSCGHLRRNKCNM